MLFTPVIWAGKGSTWNEGRHSARAVTALLRKRHTTPAGMNGAVGAIDNAERASKSQD